MLGLSALSQVPFSTIPVTSNNVTVSLSGVSATGSVGTVGVDLSVLLTGVSATGSAGNVAVFSGVVVALSGVSASGSVGNVSVSLDKALTSVSATGSAGTVVPVFSLSISGVSATSGVGTVSPALTLALSGVSASGTVGTVTVAITNITIALTGVSSSGSVGTVVAATSSALTSVSATASVGNVLYGLFPILTPVSATGSVGTVGLTKSGSVALVGVTGTGVAGILTPGIDTGITGTSATASVGSVSYSLAIELPAVSAVGTAGTVDITKSGQVGLTGVLSVAFPGYVSPSATGTQGLVPYLIGVPEGMARFLLTYAAMNVGTVSYSPSDTIAAGLVISQSIAGGTTQPLYTPVSFVVSNGPTSAVPTTTVPDVAGLPSYQAGLSVSGAGLIVNTFTYSTSGTVAAGNVISQSLAAGTIVPRGTLIALTVSLGAAPVAATTTVPNVTGLYLWDAVRLLTQAQLIVEPWLYAESATVAQEYVISQSVASGTTVPTWAPITLIVSSGA